MSVAVSPRYRNFSAGIFSCSQISSIPAGSGLRGTPLRWPKTSSNSQFGKKCLTARRENSWGLLESTVNFCWRFVNASSNSGISSYGSVCSFQQSRYASSKSCRHSSMSDSFRTSSGRTRVISIFAPSPTK